MNLTEFLDKNYSRKGNIAAITLLILAYLGREGVVSEQTMYLVAGVGAVGIIVQGVLDMFGKGKVKE
jgi:hypothetical protein